MSNLNPVPGQPPAPNAVITPAASDATFRVFNEFGSVNLIVDVNGYYVPGGGGGDQILTITRVPAVFDLPPFTFVDGELSCPPGSVPTGHGIANGGLVGLALTVPTGLLHLLSNDFSTTTTVVVEVLCGRTPSGASIDTLQATALGLSDAGSTVASMTSTLESEGYARLVED